MQIHETIPGVRAALKTAGRIVFVPTMGNLHEGHITLMRLARAHGDTVVASIFVNRLQFRPGEDFEKYPRTFTADCEKLITAGVDHLFAPSEAELYPEPQRYVVLPPAEHADILEGEFRPGHFRGVATVVMKLFGIIQPQAALFGKKDYQQFMVLSSMVREFALAVDIIPGETVRAPDGLALSSRNGYLSTAERATAPQLHCLLQQTVTAIRAGNRDFASLESAAMTELRASGWLPDYLAVRRKIDLKSPTASDSALATGLVVLAAARLGNTRLIDNLEI
ncbi:MAG: pantoate--beta-alanine ligase [Rhodocyclaceae bacterium]|nr:pantoate--beta-alanine ligase [Rhodocyclaceae bacterium]MDP1958092.1 pantoate--beta-alanine ligase [Rhodocyclaceae bacterium]